MESNHCQTGSFLVPVSTVLVQDKCPSIHSGLSVMMSMSTDAGAGAGAIKSETKRIFVAGFMTTI